MEQTIKTRLTVAMTALQCTKSKLFSYIVDITRIHVLFCLQLLQAFSFPWTLRMVTVQCVFRFRYTEYDRGIT